MKAIDCNEVREFLKQHNEWRRRSVVEPLKPDAIGQSIDVVLAELDAYKAKAFIMQDVLNFFISTSQTPVAYKEMAKDALMKTPAQSLGDVRAKAVTDLIRECSYSTQVNGIATSIIDVDSAFSYADRFRRASNERSD